MISKDVYFGDFETTKFNGECVSVYLWVLLNNDDVKVGYDIDSFVNQIKKMNSIIYFHNLSFDFSYIQYYLETNKIPYKICEKQGVIYSVRFKKCELRDSMNFMPMSLAEVGENYCKHYQKTAIDYDAAEFGHVATQEEIDYCINDCRVLEEGFNNYMNTIIELLEMADCPKTLLNLKKRLTNAGIAFDAFREMSNYDKCCPKTSAVDYQLFKGAYHGGYVYSKPLGIKEDVMMIDCNSMYPYIYSSIEMPYGTPITLTSFEDAKRFKFCIFRIMIKYELKDGYIPIIGGGVGKYGGNQYQSSSNGLFEELTICSTDLELVKEFYNYEIYFIWGKGFQTEPNFYKHYADTFIEFKNRYKSGDIRRDVAKVFLNSPYGKTAMNGFQDIKVYKVNDEKGIVEGQVVGHKCDDKIFQCLPQAIAITAGARKLLLTTARDIGFENVYYMDTDSIKFKNVPTSIKCDPNILGAWKDEGHCELFKTISPKKYVYYHKRVISYTCAGFSKRTLSDNMKHKHKVSKGKAIKLMNMFDTGLELECLQSKIVTGGRALLPVKKKIN